MSVFRKTVVINVVGLTRGLIGEHTPFLQKWSADKEVSPVNPVIPAVTCSAQSTYLTGVYPDEHGIVGNGWYFQEECEVKFWRQSNKLVQAPKIWELAKSIDPSFTCSNMFWWYNMYSTVDYCVTPRPNYLADGRKIPDCYSVPGDLRDELQEELGTFPLFNFWGPNTTIKSSQWIADASIKTDEKYDPTLTLIYLPHLDYNFQRHGTQHPSVFKDLKEIDGVCEQLITYYEGKGAQVIVLSEYGITDVSQPIHLNRVLRKAGMLNIRVERGLELMDAGMSQAFAVADHQLAHVYVNDASKMEEVRALLENTQGVEHVWDKSEQKREKLDHERAGDFVVVADKDSWFTYYYWLDDKKAPDFARMVDIHKKPGYDPVEMHLNPKIPFPMPLIVWKLIKKRLGFRTLMDVIPVDATLIKGSHGRRPESVEDYPVFICKDSGAGEEPIEADQVFRLMAKELGVSSMVK